MIVSIRNIMLSSLAKKRLLNPHQDVFTYMRPFTSASSCHSLISQSHASKSASAIQFAGWSRGKHTKVKIPSSRMMRLYDIEGAVTDAQAAKEFVYALNASERKHLYEELAHFHGAEAGTVATQMEPPTRQQLKQVALHQMLPFIGFGFLDNFLMIVAGEYIDGTLGVALGISTMTAAGLGNMISDVAGLGSAHYVERLASKVGVRHPHLSPEQVDMRSTKWASNMGKVIGVTIGCLLGMFPLLIYHYDDKDKTGKEKPSSDKKT